ncbi:MAG: hypothetical protein MJB14_22270, partial [Spirochaetes bacterium]|nr:hypothetical protein [Spirochaetota bacterium]
MDDKKTTSSHISNGTYLSSLSGYSHNKSTDQQSLLNSFPEIDEDLQKVSDQPDSTIIDSQKNDQREFSSIDHIEYVQNEEEAFHFIKTDHTIYHVKTDHLSHTIDQEVPVEPEEQFLEDKVNHSFEQLQKPADLSDTEVSEPLLDQNDLLSDFEEQISEIDVDQPGAEAVSSPLAIEEQENIKENLEELDKIDEPEEIEELDEIDEDDDIEELDDLEEAEAVADHDELEELAEEVDEITYLIENIDPETGEVKAPGNIDLASVDHSLRNSKIDTIEEQPPQEIIDEEHFGIRKAEVYYNIDKQIYSKRVKSVLDISRVKNIKSGMVVPALVALSSILIIPIFYIAFSFIFSQREKVPLAENVINDKSILSKISEKQKAEAEASRLRLEEERRQLELEKSKIESTINEELEKRKAEIELEFKKKIGNLEGQGLSAAEIEKLRQEYETKRQQDLASAETERQKKLTEQNQIIATKNSELAALQQKYEAEIKKQEEMLES